MNLYAVLFYAIAALILGSTVLAVTRRNIIHAVIYLVLSFFGSAMLFYLFGAPLLAALEVIIYAGAVMILFLFIVMMLKVETDEQRIFPRGQLWPAGGLTVFYLIAGAMMIWHDPSHTAMLTTALATPQEFGAYVFQRHWLSIEIVSLILLVALVGALHIGRTWKKTRAVESEDSP